MGVKAALHTRKCQNKDRVACDLLSELKARAARADFGLTDNNYPYESLKREFVRWARQSIRRPEDYERDLKRFEEYVTVNSVRQINHDLMYGYRTWRLDADKSPRTVNREVGTIHNMLSKAVEWSRIGSNPIEGIKPLPNDSPRKQRRSLSIAEVEALFAASPDYLRRVWRMFMVTGIRKKELIFSGVGTRNSWRIRSWLANGSRNENRPRRKDS